MPLQYWHASAMAVGAKVGFLTNEACLVCRLSAEHDNNPVALQEALIAEETNSGVSAWIARRIPASFHNNKIWRTVFWVNTYCVP